MKGNIIRRRAKSIYTRSRIPGVEWSINQYVGCSFSCPYCYAKNVVSGPSEWGSWVIVKTNAPELARRHVEGKIVMSTVSDPYQPVEAKLKLTRSVLRFMDKRNELSILTKSPLVIRDIDILKMFKSVEVGLTLNSFTGREKKVLEPLTPPVRSRMNALQELHDEGIKTYAFISPVIPGITDISEVISETKDLVDYYFIEILNLRKAGKNFRKVLREEFPESYAALTENRRLNNFIKRLMEEIKPFSRKISGIETHRFIYR